MTRWYIFERLGRSTGTVWQNPGSLSKSYQRASRRKNQSQGILMNAGFAEAMKVKNFDCVVFHDVDMLPQDDHNLYACDDSPLHLSLLIDK